MGILGYTGLIILVIAFISLNTKWKQYFVLIDTIATGILCAYAITQADWVFIIANGLIFLSLLFNLYKKGIKNEIR